MRFGHAPEGNHGCAKAGDDWDERAEDDSRDAGHLQVCDLGHQPRMLTARRQVYGNRNVCIPGPPERYLPRTAALDEPIF